MSGEYRKLPNWSNYPRDLLRVATVSRSPSLPRDSVHAHTKIRTLAIAVAAVNVPAIVVGYNPIEFKHEGESCPRSILVYTRGVRARSLLYRLHGRRKCNRHNNLYFDRKVGDSEIVLRYLYNPRTSRRKDASRKTFKTFFELKFWIYFNLI